MDLGCETIKVVKRQSRKVARDRRKTANRVLVCLKGVAREQHSQPLRERSSTAGVIAPLLAPLDTCSVCWLTPGNWCVLIEQSLLIREFVD